MTFRPSARKTRHHAAPPEKLALACVVCQQRNYKIPASSGTHQPGFSLNKFCATCNRHTEHQPTR